MEADEKICPFCAETIKASASVCKHCGRNLVLGQTVTQSAINPVTPKKKTGGCMKIFLGVIVLLVVMGVFGAIIDAGKTPEQRQQEASRRAAENALDAHRDREKAMIRVQQDKERSERQAQIDREKSRFESAIPTAEKDLIAAVAAGYQEFRKGENDIQREKSRDGRKMAIASALGGDEAIDWIGTIDSITTNSEGFGVLSITLSSDPDVTVSTWNNAISDAFDNTLIQKSSPVYSAMGSLKDGEKVVFSGRFIGSDRDFIREGSMTISGSMRAPDFKMVFIKLERFQ